MSGNSRLLLFEVYPEKAIMDLHPGSNKCCIKKRPPEFRGR
jgi:hypothetical protein